MERVQFVRVYDRDKDETVYVNVHKIVLIREAVRRDKKCTVLVIDDGTEGGDWIDTNETPPQIATRISLGHIEMGAC